MELIPCDRCRFWLPPPKDGLRGYCRVHGPRSYLVGWVEGTENDEEPLPIFESYWPPTSPDDACGDGRPCGKPRRPAVESIGPKTSIAAELGRQVAKSLRDDLGVETWVDLTRWPVQHILVCRFVGEAKLREIRAGLRRRGLALKGEQCP